MIKPFFICVLNTLQMALNTVYHLGVAQSVTCLATGACLTADPGGREFDPGPVPYFRGD